MPAPVSGFAAEHHLLRDICQAIPPLFLQDHDLAGAAAALVDVAALATALGAGEGAQGISVPVSARDPEPDVLASLWFIRAAHLLGRAAAPGSPEKAIFSTKLLPLSKRLLQEFITDKGVGGVRMDDGGLLIPPGTFTQGLRLNALWYSALETTAQDLKASGDRVADHFERLAGRFRRSFVKAYWCDVHGCICRPDMRGLPDHGLVPDADQLLLTCLPASPIPRTKQRQLLGRVQSTALGRLGVRVAYAGHGFVESPMHLAWLARGWVASADPPASGVAEAAAMLEPLHALLPLAHTEGMPAYYVTGQPVPGQAPSLTTRADVLAAIQALK